MSFKRVFSYIGATLFFSLQISAQENKSVFDFLNLPTSSHAMALGGKSVSLIEDDASLAFQNPALLTSVSDRTLNFNFITYLQGSNTGNLSYVQSSGERGVWGIMGQFVSYGKFPGYDENKAYVGDISGLDLSLSGGYSYLLSDHWAGGINGKFIYSNYAGYSSVALAVDLGINYYNIDRDFSFSATANNIGGQVTAFGDVEEHLPFDIQLGVSKGIEALPLKLHLTLFDLLHWNKSHFFAGEKGLSTFQLILNHINLGADIYLFKNRFWLGLGYNFRRGFDMGNAGGSGIAGLTAGAGINIKRIKFGVAYANYYPGAPTLSFTLAYAFAPKDKNNANTQ